MPLSRSHPIATLRHSDASYHRQLRSFNRYLDEESHNYTQSAVNAEGELWEQETLQLRASPPIIDIDNEATEDATKITLSSANRPGTLVEVVTRLVELSLIVKNACIASDRGWFADDFCVTERNGDKVRDPEKIEQLKKANNGTPCAQLMHCCVDIKCGTPWKWRRRRRYVPNNSDAWMMVLEMTVLEMYGSDRPGLLADITQLLSKHDYDVKSAAVWTQGMNVAFVMKVMPLDTETPSVLSDVCDRLKLALKGPGSDGCVAVREPVCVGRVHHEHRLHCMLLKAQKDSQENRTFQSVTVDDISCRYRSPKLGKPNVSIRPDQRWDYWIVQIQCKDRSKLLFDTVCTLADLEFDVYHGSVDCRNDLAVLELFVRPRYPHKEPIQDRVRKVQQFLEHAIIRRFPKGLKLHIHPLETPGCLGTLLEALKSAHLCVTRAKVRYNEYGRVMHTVYVMNDDGTPPNRDDIEAKCAAVGGRNLSISDSQGSGSETGESESLHTFAFMLKERTPDGWEGKSHSV